MAILPWINFQHLHISHYKILWKTFCINDLDCVAENIKSGVFVSLRLIYIRCYLKSFYIHGTIPSRDYMKRKNNTGKNFVTENAQFSPWIKKFIFTKSFLFIQKALNLKVITGNYSEYIHVVNSQMKTSQENLFVQGR